MSLLLPSDRECADLSAATYVPGAIWDKVIEGDASDGVWIGIKKTPGYDFIVPRGSFVFMDWERDAMAAPFLYEPFGLVPYGFFLGALKAYALIRPLITQPVILTGHSLGGVRAQHQAGLLTLAGIIPAKVCVFGSPEPGCQKFAEVVAPISNYTLYHNKNDLVPPNPPTTRFFPLIPPRPETMIDIPPLPGDTDPLFRSHHIFLYREGAHG